MRRRLTPTRLVLAAVVLAVAAAIALYLVPSNDYILLPDKAHPVAPLVHVEGGHDPRGAGQLFFVDVFERRASLLEKLIPFIRSGSSLVPARLLIPPGVSDKAVRQADLREMTVSQRVAAAVALRRLGYHVTAKPNGVVVDAVDVGSHALGKLEPTDVITTVDGRSTPTIGKLRRALARVRPGETVTLGVSRGSQRLELEIRTIADPLQRRRAIVGFSPDQAADIRLPLKVQIDAGNVGGPSAGLAFALEVLAELGRNVTHGYRVAATGQIELDGTVTPIGGAKQKIFGARLAHVQVFLVPAGDNAAVARRYAHGVRVIAVKTFPQALNALAALPQRS
jgi:PDZ domain-containing protein